MNSATPMQPFLPQFRNDVFLSYRHAQDEGPTPWVSSIHDQLVCQLEGLLGNIKIWMDKGDLHAGDRWHQVIREELGSAAIFVGLFSMTYLQSQNCRNELDEFLGVLKGDKEQHTLVPVFMHPVDEATIPSEVKETHREVKFYEPEPPPSTHFREYRPDADVVARGKFVEAVARLAQDLRDALRTIKNRVPPPSKGTVFLAAVKPELYEVWEQLRADLRQHGYSVVPELNYMWNSDEFATALAGDLDRADLCVHVVSQTGSSDPDAAAHARLQLEKAAEAMKRRSRPAPLVWIRPFLQGTKDPAAAALVELIQTELANEGTEYWEHGLEEFKTGVHDRLPGEAAATSVEVAVVAEDGDLRATQSLGAFLSDTLKVEPVRLHFAAPAPPDLAAFAANVARCSHTIVFWGAAPEQWVSEVLRLPPIVEKAQAHRVCVYGAPPTTAEKETFRSSRASLLLETTGGVNEGELRRFLGAGASR